MQSLLRAGQFYACFMENIKAEFGLKLNKHVELSSFSNFSAADG